jgi:hypothetical protein
MTVSDLASFLRRNVVEQFCRYVSVNTASSEKRNQPIYILPTGSGAILSSGLRHGLSLLRSEHGYVYATLPASPGVVRDP